MEFNDHTEYAADLQKLEDGFHEWSSLAPAERVRCIRKLRRIISKHSDDLARALSNECHRPLTESLAQEILPVLEMARYCEKKFPRWLRTRRFRYMRPGFMIKQNHLIRQPLGVMLVITPANFPFTLGMMSMIYMLLAGNTVVIKPAENSTEVGPLIEKMLLESGLAPRFAQVVPGGPATGEWLVERQEIRKVFFFGRQENGLSVLKKCGELSKPCVMELGGGSTAVVTADADLKLAAAGLAWSGFYSNGQSCIGTDRILVDETVASEFEDLLLAEVRVLQDEFVHAEKHPAFLPRSQSEQLMGVIEDAKGEGCKVLLGGGHTSNAAAQETLEFTVLSVPETNLSVFGRELHGPVIAMYSARDLQGKLSEINTLYPSLGVSLWGRSGKRMLALARGIQASMIWINDSSFGLPCLPWHGLGNTGWGQLFSEHSLHEVLEYKWISHHPARGAFKRTWWPPYSALKEKLFSFAARRMFR